MQRVVGSILAVGSLLLAEISHTRREHDEGRRSVDDLHGKDCGYIRAEAAFNKAEDMVGNDWLVGERSYLSMWRRHKGRVSTTISWQGFAQQKDHNLRSMSRSALGLHLPVAIADYTSSVHEQARYTRQAAVMTSINSLVYVLSIVQPGTSLTFWVAKPLSCWYRRRKPRYCARIRMARALASTGQFMHVDQVFTSNVAVANVVMFDVAFGLVGDLCLDHKYGCSLGHVACISYEGCFDVDRDALIFAYSPYPATKGIPREEMDLLFREGDASLISSMAIDYR
ncbi:hypothetical protein FRC09_000320 [Ceratobasidium sp. 395]|nr:hypothetical protein FRC09_000320 [Ceratobasidium sp. 395]